MKTPAIFLDRDGVINKDHGYIATQDNFEYIEGVFDACLELKEMGFLLVVVTNQSGIARGLYSEDDFIALTEWMDWNFADKGVDLDGIFYCPHHPDFTDECDCRKPKPGMFLTAKDSLDIDMEKSFVVGDKLSDLQAAKTAGVTTKILVRTGKALLDETISFADHTVDSIKNVPKLIKYLNSNLD